MRQFRAGRRGGSAHQSCYTRFATKALWFGVAFLLANLIPLRTDAGAGVETPPLRNLYIVAIGVDSLSCFPYSYAKADAVALAKSLGDQPTGAPGFAKIVTSVLLDRSATREGVRAALDKVAQDSQPDDVFVFFFAGMALESTARGGSTDYYLLLSDLSCGSWVGPRQDQPSPLGLDGVLSGTELGARFGRIRARNQLIVLDSNDPGTAFPAAISKMTDRDPALAALVKRNVMLLGTQGASFESADLKHGILTFTLLVALDGSADVVDDRTITLWEIEAALPRVALTKSRGSLRIKSYAQGDDFPLKRRRATSAPRPALHPTAVPRSRRTRPRRRSFRPRDRGAMWR